MLNFFKNNGRKINGSLGYFGLGSWWLSEFSEVEREHIIRVFQPLGFGESSLIKGEIISTSETPIEVLSVLTF